MRTAAVLAGHPDHDPSVVFGHVKQLYNYRSAVAHGDAKRTAKLRNLEIGGELVSSIELATSYLRGVAQELAKRDDISGASDVDSKLILRTLAEYGEWL